MMRLLELSDRANKILRTGVLIALGLAIGTQLLLLALGIRFNYSPSVPTGWYRTAPEARAIYVEFCPPQPFGAMALIREYRGDSFVCPDGGTTLLKRILGEPGDFVTVTAEGLLLNGRSVPNSKPMPVDSKGRPLSAYAPGQYLVRHGELWVVGDHPRSFDSRYYGPVSRRLVRNFAEPLYVTASRGNQ